MDRPAAAAPGPASACSIKAEDGWMERVCVCGGAEWVHGGGSKSETCTVRLPTVSL